MALRLVWLLIAPLLMFGQPGTVEADNDEVKEIFRQDQRDRGEDPFDPEASKSLKTPEWKAVLGRDAERLKRVRELVRSGGVRTAQDQVYAAFILQHGRSADDFALAHVLAATAAFKSQPAPRWARWLAAASMDRFLHSTGQAQIFGTQVKGEKSAGDTVVFTLEPYNRTAVTDSIRKEWCVIDLAKQETIVSNAAQGKPLGPSNIRDCR